MQKLYYDIIIKEIKITKQPLKYHLQKRNNIENKRSDKYITQERVVDIQGII